MKLRDLLQDIPVLSSAVDFDTEIREVRYDSRAVEPGDLFVAIRGFAADGHEYIGMALKKGAAAVVCQEAGKGIPAIVVADTRAALADIAGNRFGHPSAKLKMIGVTGTNGKTTTTTLIKHILECQGFRVGLIGTNQNMIGGTGDSNRTHHTGILRASGIAGTHGRGRLHALCDGGVFPFLSPRPCARGAL